MSDGSIGRLAPLALATLLAVVPPAPAAAQVRDTVIVAPVPAPPQESVELPDIERPTTPGGAFLRAVLLPGWGHASIGAYTRGGIYFAAETTTALLLARTIWRLGIAKDARDMKEDRLTEALLAAGTDPDSVPGLVAEDPEVRRSQRLVNSRTQQVEDWAALGVFFIFLSGADAFVSAHLRDFPEPVEVDFDVAPRSAGGGVALRLTLPLGARAPDR